MLLYNANNEIFERKILRFPPAREAPKSTLRGLIHEDQNANGSGNGGELSLARRGMWRGARQGAEDVAINQSPLV